MKTILLLNLVAVLVMGCVPMQGPSSQEHAQALKLVDQGVLALRAGDLDAALASFQMADELSPIAAAIDGLGCVALLKGDLDTSERLLWQAYNMDQSYDNALTNLALLYELRGDKARAEELYKQALQAEPGNFRARSNFVVLMHDNISRGAHLQGSASADPQVEAELRKTYALAPHPIVAHNLERLNLEF